MKRGADVLVETLEAGGVRFVFALSGNHVMPVFDALVDSDIALVHARHEAACVHMADAFARLTDSVGVALVTGGPGHANAVAALYTATMAESPVVLLSGHAPRDHLGMGAFQEMRQADIAEPLCKASWTCASADEVANDMLRAMRIARSGRPGPVHLSLPVDCLDGRSDSAPAAEPPRLREADVEDARNILLRAKAPIVLCGPASCTKRGRARMAALEEALGIPVIGMESPRGVADPNLGDLRSVLAKADCIMLLGKRLDFTLQFGKPMRADCVYVQLDPETNEIDRTARAVGERLRASAVVDVDPAIEGLMRNARKQSGGWREDVRAAIAYRPAEWAHARAPNGRLHPVQALRPLQSMLDTHPDAVFVSDGGEFGQWAQACLMAPNRVINGVAGVIGAALPFAVGARAAKPGVPIIATLGDGTFGFHPAEIDTAVRHRLPFVAVIGNDARWNAEYQIQVREYGAERARGCELLPTRYDEVAKAFGGYGVLVTRPEDLLPAARRAHDSATAACINVLIEGVPAPTIRR
jgi:acetolactate synthase-1/2/3 large subunit